MGEYILLKIKAFYLHHPLLTIFGLSLFSSLFVNLVMPYIYSSYRPAHAEITTEIESVEATPQPTPVFAEKVVIDISGAVNKPGVYSFSLGSRLADALKESGGVTASASAVWVAENINLSKKLKDEEKIYIPFETDLAKNAVLDNIIYEQFATNPTPTGIKESNLINVNTASDSELDTLAGVGPVYAQKIINNRPYKDFDDFGAKSTLPISLSDKLKSLITY